MDLEMNENEISVAIKRMCNYLIIFEKFNRLSDWNFKIFEIVVLPLSFINIGWKLKNEIVWSGIIYLIDKKYNL